uniref:Uncharacterized protein n=1 Tax=Anguilla anguilla TaxID=7936 RepID=A0A0E9US58_ANGAN
MSAIPTSSVQISQD